MIKLSSKYVIMSKDRKYGFSEYSDGYVYFELSNRYHGCKVDNLVVFNDIVDAEIAIRNGKVINTYGCREFKKYDVEVVEVERFIK